MMSVPASTASITTTKPLVVVLGHSGTKANTSDFYFELLEPVQVSDHSTTYAHEEWRPVPAEIAQGAHPFFEYFVCDSEMAMIVHALRVGQTGLCVELRTSFRHHLVRCVRKGLSLLAEGYGRPVHLVVVCSDWDCLDLVDLVRALPGVKYVRDSLESKTELAELAAAG